MQRPEVGEALLVSTCNRVELVAAGRCGLRFGSRPSRQGLRGCAGRARAGHRAALVRARGRRRGAAPVPRRGLARFDGPGRAADFGSGEGSVRARAQRRARWARCCIARCRARFAPPSACAPRPRSAAGRSRCRASRSTSRGRYFGDLSGRVALLVGSGRNGGGRRAVAQGRGRGGHRGRPHAVRAEELANAVGGSGAPVDRAASKAWSRPTWWSPAPARRTTWSTTRWSAAARKRVAVRESVLHRPGRAA